MKSARNFKISLEENSIRGKAMRTSPTVKSEFEGRTIIPPIRRDASWGSEKTSYNLGGSEQSNPGIPLSVYEGKGGVAFFLNGAVALDFTMGYQSTTTKESNIKLTTASFLIGAGFQVYIRTVKK